MPYQSGDCIMFRGAEMEHFVSDWTGYRIFLLYTNHQPVRNYAHRIMGKLPPKPNDHWHPDRLKAKEDGVQLPLVPSTENTNTSRYSPCVMAPLSPEPESLTREELYGPAIDPSDSSYVDSSNSDKNGSPTDRKEEPKAEIAQREPATPTRSLKRTREEMTD
ncbi:hypothetical protein HD806DRAFT_442517 [Xylariaceae sp. AK1471]|nr:hypothetical protein HD806DRAFT_442517 [Xylariaceae sp. AK1471]